MEILFSSMGQDYKTVMGMLFQTIFVIAMVEEGCKYFSFKLMIFHDRAFDNTYDGVIYGAAAALGFATLENILYVFQGGFGTEENACCNGGNAGGNGGFLIQSYR